MALIVEVSLAITALVQRMAVVTANAIASTVGVRSARMERLIQFLLYALIACPLMILAIAAVTWAAVSLAHLLAGLL